MYLLFTNNYGKPHLTNIITDLIIKQYTFKIIDIIIKLNNETILEI
jgi:hypothetical protein